LILLAGTYITIRVVLAPGSPSRRSWPGQALQTHNQSPEIQILISSRKHFTIHRMLQSTSSDVRMATSLLVVATTGCFVVAASEYSIVSCSKQNILGLFLRYFGWKGYQPGFHIAM